MFVQKHRSLIFAVLVLVLVSSATVLTLGAGNIILWSNTASSTWQTPTNWTGGVVPDTTDTAQFGVNPTATTGVGIDMGAATNNGAANQAVGGIEVTVARGSKIGIGNSSPVVSGTLTLNGSTLNGTPNAILRNGCNKDLTITDVQGSGSKTMNVALNDATDNVVLVDGSGNVVIASTVTEPIAGKRLTIAGVGSGRVDITNAANQFTGGLFCKGAEVRVTTDLSLGPVPSTASDNITIDGGRFGTVSGGVVTIDPHRNIVLGSTAGTSISAPGSSATILTYNGVLKDLTTGGILVKQGQGILEVGGISTYTGDTFINNGTIQLAVGDNRLPPAAALSLGQTASANLGIFDLNGFNQQVAGLNSTLGTNAAAGFSNIVSSAAPAILTLGGSGNYSYGDNTNLANSGQIAQFVAIQKTGPGTQTFGDANTYSGGTTINAGTLLVTNTAGSATGTGAVTVGTGATLGGNGKISGPVAIQSGAILSPGNLSAATLSTGSLTIDPAAVLNFDLGTVSDQVAVMGDLALGGTLNATAGVGFASGRYVLFSYTGTLSGNGLTLGSAPASGYTFDTSVAGQVAVVVAPKVISINRDTPVGADTNATNVLFRVTFSSDVTGVDATDFAVTAVSGNVGTVAVGSITPVSGSVYTVAVDTSTGSGEIRLDLVDDDSIKDATLAPLGGTGTGNGNFTTGQTYRVDHAPLTVTVDQAVTQADPTHVNSIKFTAVFNKAVSDFDASKVTVGGTSTGGTATVVNSGDNKTYTITIAGMASDGTADGTVAASVAANLSHDVAGNGNTASTSTDNSVTFDTVAPTVVNITSSVGEGAYNIGAQLPITIQFSEPVTVLMGVPQLKLATGAVQRVIDASGGSGTNTLTFMYIVQPGDTSSDLNYVDTSALTLNGATIADAAGNPAVITLPGLANAGALGVNKNIVIDSVPVITTIVPAVGPTSGGSTVAVNGNNLSQAAITFAGTAGTMLTATNAQVILLTPPHASGSVDVAAVGPQATATKTAGYLYDDAPVVTSLPVVSTTSPLAGRPISVTLAATDPESEPLTITYNWGDGTPVDSTGTHVYAAPGTYLITTTVSDGNNVVVETTIVTVAGTTAMKTTKLSGAYKPTGVDTVTFTTVINGVTAGFVFANQPITINVGGAAQAFTLTSKNKAVVGKSTIGIKAKLKKNTQGQLALVSGPVTVTGKLTGNFANVWLADGIDPTKDAKKQVIHMTVDCVLNGVTYTNDVAPLLTGKANKGGKFTFSQR